jgi:NAD+ kinase
VRGVSDGAAAGRHARERPSAPRRLGVIGNRRYPGLPALLARILDAAPAVGLVPAFDEELHALADGGERLDGAEALDVLLTLGGDGTMLRGARFLQGAQVPLLGINIGRLGFLTCCGVERLERAIEDFAAGRHIVEQRMALAAYSERGEAGAGWRALNDVVLHKTGFARVVHMKVMVNGETTATFAADGLIVATPTGSTGYSLSAGGPVVVPTVESLIVTPISAHTLALRPMVLPPDAVVALQLEEPASEILVTVDGQVGATISSDDVLVVRRAERPVLFVRFPDTTFFSLMRRKLGWGGIRERDETPPSSRRVAEPKERRRVSDRTP